MTVYAACWQDETEPWGWAPVAVFHRREDAEARLEEEIEAYARATRDDHNRFFARRAELVSLDTARAWGRRCHSIQEYEVL